MIPSLPLGFLKIIPENQKQSGLLDGLNLKPGRIVDAKVLDVTSQNRVQLLVGGQKLTVSTRLALTRGMDIPMKVIRSQDGIVLKPLTGRPSPASTDTSGPTVNTGRPISSLPAVSPDSTPLPGADKSFQTMSSLPFSPAKIFLGLGALSRSRESTLNDILMGLSLKSDVRDDQFLPKIIENMGLSFEKKLATGLNDAPDKKTIAHMIQETANQDLKAAVLTLAGTESDPNKTTALKQISDALDNFAQLNIKSGDSGQNPDGTRFLLPFPVWRGDGFDFGQLMVDMGKKDSTNTEKKMLSISFLLNMTVLGPLRADFSILDKTITGLFLLENQETCDYFIPKLAELKQRLSGIGYQTGSIDCRVALPEQIAPTSLMLSMKTPDDIQGLNIVV